MNSELRLADYTGMIQNGFVIGSRRLQKKSFKLLTLLWMKVPVTRGCDCEGEQRVNYQSAQDTIKILEGELDASIQSHTRV